MTRDNQTEPLILVVEDVHETRYGMEKLLTADGYRVSLARDEADAIENAEQKCPDLILVSLPSSPSDVILAATRIRKVADEGERLGAYDVKAINADGVTVIGPEGAMVLRPIFDPAPPAPVRRTVQPARVEAPKPPAR